MAFEIIEWFQAVQASPNSLAGGGTKFADTLCMKGIAMWALHGFEFVKAILLAGLLRWVWGSDAKSFELLFPGFTHPIGCPCG